MCRVGARPGTAGGSGAGNELCTPVTTNQPTSDTGGSTTKKSCHRSPKFVFAGPALDADPPAPEAARRVPEAAPLAPEADPQTPAPARPAGARSGPADAVNRSAGV